VSALGSPLINGEGGELTIDSAAFSGHASGELLRVTGGSVRVVNSSFMGRTSGRGGGGGAAGLPSRQALTGPQGQQHNLLLGAPGVAQGQLSPEVSSCRPTSAPRRPAASPPAPAAYGASSSPSAPSPDAQLANMQAQLAHAERERAQLQAALATETQQDWGTPQPGSHSASTMQYGSNYDFDDELAELQEFHRNLVARSMGGGRGR
jgi:hypothetical protein